jgi:hypothetical protein
MQRGFTKLFNTIVTSTIWQEDDKTRIVWITMLAIADAAGIVGASIPGLASVSNVSVNAARAAVKTLLAPDADSRTKDFDGRRIEEIDGGWRILNHAKYRRMLNEEERKEYKAKWIAEKRRQESTVDKRRQSSTTSRRAAIMSTQAEAEAEATKKEGANGSRPQSVFKGVEDWLNELEADKTYQGIDVRREYGKMLNWCKLRSKKPTQRRFINWLNNAEKTLPAQHAARPDYKRNYAPPAREPTQEEIDNARRIAHEETARFKEQFK